MRDKNENSIPKNKNQFRDKRKKRKTGETEMRRINIRLRFGHYTFFMALSKTQKLKGITSKVVDAKDMHYIFFDIENTTIQEVILSLRKMQYEHKLGDIIIESDYPTSFRAFCFSKRPFKEYLRILLDTPNICYNFFYWTVYRGSATIRTSQKQGRRIQHAILLKGYEKTEMPKNIIQVNYETGIEKTGMLITNG